MLGCVLMLYLPCYCSPIWKETLTAQVIHFVVQLHTFRSFFARAGDEGEEERMTKSIFLCFNFLTSTKVGKTSSIVLNLYSKNLSSVCVCYSSVNILGCALRHAPILYLQASILNQSHPYIVIMVWYELQNRYCHIHLPNTWACSHKYTVFHTWRLEKWLISFSAVLNMIWMNIKWSNNPH